MVASHYTDTAVGGSAFVIDDGRDDGEVRTRVKKQRPFYFTAHPERWRVMGGKVRPDLAKGVKVYSGVHNMTKGRGGKVRGVRAAIAHKESRGRIVIPLDAVPDSHVDPGEPKSYLYQPPGRPDVTLDIYTRAFPGSTRLSCDLVRWYEFLDHLVESGVIPECPVYVLERMLDSETKKHDKAADKASSVPSFAARAKIHADAIEAIRKELDGRYEKATPVRRTSVKIEDAD